MVTEPFGYLNVASIWRNSAKHSEEEGIAFRMTKVILEGWMVRYGRRKIGRSFIHKRYLFSSPGFLPITNENLSKTRFQSSPFS